jgi:hypothetical protein
MPGNDRSLKALRENVSCLVETFDVYLVIFLANPEIFVHTKF